MGSDAQHAAAGPAPAGAALGTGAVALTDWVRITRDDRVTLVVSQAEMGQGISTTLPAILADELGADWSRVVFELAPTSVAYRNPRINWQFTGNSESTQSFAALMRKVGATARAMLVAAAAERWNVPAGECTTEAGKVRHRPSGRSASFGDLAEAAGKLPPPADPPLRPEAELRLVGRAVPRVDVPDKVDGSALFGIDYVPPGVQDVVFTAVISAPAYDARLVSVDRAALLAREGVIEVVELPGAVAVVARRYWQARAALAAAKIAFDAGPHQALDSAALAKLYAEKLENGPFVTTKDVAAPAPAKVATRYSATYTLPFQAHATLEPMNALARVTASGVDLWAPTQGQELAKFAVAGALKVDPANVNVYRVPYLGGGFGRRLLPDFCVEAALIARAVGKPVKVIWSREEDMRRSHFRPATAQRISAQLDAQGYPVALAQRLVSPSILKVVFPPLDLSKGIDPSCLEGTQHTPYATGGWRAEFHLLSIRPPTSVYRTTGYGPSLFGMESFVDELARRAGADPYRYRRRLLGGNTRAITVLDAAAKKAGWGAPLPAGHGRGIALVEAFDTLLAQVVEVSVAARKVRVRRVVSAVDPGTVYDPAIAAAGIEGGVVFGLSSCVNQEITFAGGGPMQRNFPEYDMVRMAQCPAIETVFLQTPGVKVGGIGEVGPVAVVPALANAIAAATGRRLRTMPLARSGLTLA
jgi:isoquinoline 1-oxidoreductase beta subunit